MRDKWIADGCDECDAPYVLEKVVIDRNGAKVPAHVCIDCGHIKPLIVLPLHSPPHPLPDKGEI